MNNTIQEVSVDLHDWRDEQAAWNNIYYLQLVVPLSTLVVVLVIMHLD